MDKRYFSEKVVKWYENNKRSLPWRETIEPYKIWLSEIILQQTRVAQGLPYYLAFVKKYPNVQALAEAPEQEILRLWQGLGYYSRARNLHKCAKVVVSEYRGKFPSTFNELQQLPGVGAYTAAAIASFCFREKVAVVDGNVFRVLARVFGIDQPINSGEGKVTFARLANDLISEKRPDLHNQAIMEFGAMHCTPKSPQCETCPLQKGCIAYHRERQSELPVKLKLTKARKRYFYYFVFENKGAVWMKRRDEKDIWNGLFDFWLVEKSKQFKPEKVIEEALGNISDETRITKVYKHVLTHQTIYSRFIVVKHQPKQLRKTGNSGYYSLSQIDKLPKPVLVSRFLADHYIL